MHELTAKCHTLIDQIKEKGMEISEVESDRIFYSHPIYAQNGPYIKLQSTMRESEKIECYTFTPTNIQNLLIELDLGENPEKIFYWERASEIMSQSDERIQFIIKQLEYHEFATGWMQGKMFMAASGHCCFFGCNHDIIQEKINKNDNSFVTGCPKCFKSFCD